MVCMTRPAPVPTDQNLPTASPYIELKRSQWQKLRKSMPQVLTEDELEQLRGIGDEIDLE